MTTPPNLPASGNTSWYSYEQWEDAEVRLLQATFVNVKDPAVGAATGNGTTDDTVAIQNAISSLDATNGGVVWFPPGLYNFSTLNITGKRVTLDGPGKLYNGTLNIGAQTGNSPTEMYTRIRVGFDRSTKSSTANAISLANSHDVEIGPLTFANYRALVNCPSLALGGTNQQHSARIRITGVMTPSWPAGIGSWPDYLVYINPNSTGGAFSVGDLSVIGNPNVSVRVGHIRASGLDGLVCTGNTFFFPNYAAGDTTKTSHVDLEAASGFINISGNQFFESGYESVILNGTPANVEIVGNHVAWSGQRDLKDAVAITISGTQVLRGTISGNNFELYTKAAVAFYGTGDATGVVIGPNAAMADNPNVTYYGTTTLPSSFYRYTSVTGLAGQPRIADAAGLHYTWTKQDLIGGITADSQQRLGPVDKLTSIDKFVSVTAANTACILLSEVRGNANVRGGLILVYAEDNGSPATRAATYLLLVTKTSTGRTVTQVAATGETTGAAATAPSFTWSVNTGEFLCASPVASTTGTFHFSFTAVGNLAPSW